MAAVERRPVDGRMAAVEHRRDVVWGCGLRLRFPLVYMYIHANLGGMACLSVQYIGAGGVR